MQPLVKTVRVGHDELAGGIPVAPYRVSATLITETGARVPLLVALEYDGPKASSQNITFIGSGDCDLRSGIEWLRVYVHEPR